ncbi:hypothetical protein C7475_101909 [Chitinophaga sp. S165]|nr:hypothetical protein C7475_101909 [Chitinophaga sp. S165]
MGLKKQATFSFCVFGIIVLKYLLVNLLGIINPNSSWHRILSSFFIMPLLLAGVYYSLEIIIDNYREKRQLRKLLINWNVIISLPTLLVFLFLLGQIISLFVTIP